MLSLITPYNEDTVYRQAEKVARTITGRVLDVGGAAKPLRRATHVLDVVPYDRRRQDEGRGELPEFFTSDTWLVHDVNDTPWPFEDDYFDYVWCCQVVEDIRDPIAVCREMQRVAPRGFISTVHRSYEASVVQEDGVIGYHHHRWLIEVWGTSVLRFMFKSPILQIDPSVRPPYEPSRWLLNVEWERPFEPVEPIANEGWLQREELDEYLRDRRYEQ